MDQDCFLSQSSSVPSCVSSSDFILLRTISVESDLQAIENVLNPETVKAIQEIDDSLRNHHVRYEEAMRSTISAVSDAHASSLFLPCAKEALSLLKKHISATVVADIIPSWKDLAGALQFDSLTISVINNPDPAECLVTILKSFSTKPESKLKDIIEAFFIIKRYDCLQVAVDHFPAIASTAAQQEMKITSCDKAVTINGNSTLQNLMDELKRSLPEILLPATTQVKQVCEPVKVIPDIRSTTNEILVQSALVSPQNVKPSVKKSSKKKYLKKVMITFTPDGKETAHNVAGVLRQMQPLPVGVVILSEHPDLVESNPYHVISHQVARMDFVIPIVTPGYLNALGKKPPVDSTDIDAKYVQLIHRLLSSEYIQNCCLNRKVRAVIPDAYLDEVHNHCHFSVDDLLRVFYSESELHLFISRSINKNFNFSNKKSDSNVARKV